MPIRIEDYIPAENRSKLKEYFVRITKSNGAPAFNRHNLFLAKGDVIAALTESIITKLEISLKVLQHLLNHPEISEIETHCPVCGKKMKNLLFSNGQLRQTCSASCSKVYGKRAESMRSSMMEKYGVVNPFQCETVREKAKQTCIERYGCANPMQSPEIQEKVRQTNIRKMGVANPWQSEEVKAKIKQTNLERHGVEYILKSEEIRSKNKYRMRRKLREDKRKEFLEMLKSKEIDLLSSSEEYLVDDNLRFRCKKCGLEFEVSFAVGTHSNYRVWCPDCHKSHSNGEDQLYSFVKSLIPESVKILRNCKSILKDHKELDIYVPSLNIALEYDGIYFHNAMEKDNLYHLRKTEECAEKGIDLIHVFETDWIYKRDIVESIISAKFGVFGTVIYARKCKIKLLAVKEYRQFLDINHLQGYAYASTRLGLFYNDELVACIGIGKSRFRKEETELIRFCTKINTKVVGGLSRLIKNANIGSMVSYLDRRYFTGSGYEKVGFVKIGASSPGYIYCKGNQIFSRYQCQKHKLQKILEDKFDPNLSETENMTNAGYLKIYDCGMLKFVK